MLHALKTVSLGHIPTNFIHLAWAGSILKSLVIIGEETLKGLLEDNIITVDENVSPN